MNSPFINKAFRHLLSELSILEDIRNRMSTPRPSLMDLVESLSAWMPDERIPAEDRFAAGYIIGHVAGIAESLGCTRADVVLRANVAADAKRPVTGRQGDVALRAASPRGLPFSHGGESPEDRLVRYAASQILKVLAVAAAPITFDRLRSRVRRASWHMEPALGQLETAGKILRVDGAWALVSDPSN